MPRRTNNFGNQKADNAARSRVAAMSHQTKLAQALKSSGLPISIRTATREIAAGRVPGAVMIGKRWHCSSEQLRAALIHIPARVES